MKLTHTFTSYSKTWQIVRTKTSKVGKKGNHRTKLLCDLREVQFPTMLICANKVTSEPANMSAKSSTTGLMCEQKFLSSEIDDKSNPNPK